MFEGIVAGKVLSFVSPSRCSSHLIYAIQTSYPATLASLSKA